MKIIYFFCPFPAPCRLVRHDGGSRLSAAKPRRARYKQGAPTRCRKQRVERLRLRSSGRSGTSPLISIRKQRARLRSSGASPLTSPFGFGYVGVFISLLPVLFRLGVAGGWADFPQPPSPRPDQPKWVGGQNWGVFLCLWGFQWIFFCISTVALLCHGMQNAISRLRLGFSAFWRISNFFYSGS